MVVRVLPEGLLPLDTVECPESASIPLIRMSCTYMFLSLLPEATTVEFQAKVPTLDVWAVNSLI